MPKPMVGVQPTVLRWARESQGLSVAEVAHRLKRDPKEITEWEDDRGQIAPTYSQLEQLAYTIYKRPLALFFFPSPPSEPTPRQEFRTLPDFKLEMLSSTTRMQLRLGRALQLSLLELHGGVNPSERKIFHDLATDPFTNIERFAQRIRDYLGISVLDQSVWRVADDALKAWREAIEEVGVYVFKNSFKQKEISGFCLWHNEFPIIYLNNGTTKTRQIFSLFHELVHLLLHMNSISETSEAVSAELPSQARKIERFCNAVTAEFLVPSADFDTYARPGKPVDDTQINELSNRYAVSRQVVLRRFLDRNLITEAYYNAKVDKWSTEAVEIRSQGGDYYATQATYLGDRYLRLVFGQLYQGKLTREEAADYFGVKAKSIVGLEEIMLKRGISA